MSIGVNEILSACEHTRKVTLFEPFLDHFADIDYACVLSEICLQSAEALKRDPAGCGWLKDLRNVGNTYGGLVYSGKKGLHQAGRAEVHRDGTQGQGQSFQGNSRVHSASCGTYSKC